MMYVADLNPPSDPEETVKMVSACNGISCEFQPDNNNDEEFKDMEDAKSIVSNPEKDISVVECQSIQPKRLKKQSSRLHWSDSAVVSSPYQAIFKNLRINIDYTIKLNFIMSGHTLGVVSFTLAAENRKSSSVSTLESSSEDGPPRKVSDASTASSKSSMSVDDFEDDPYSLIRVIECQEQYENIVKGISVS